MIIREDAKRLFKGICPYTGKACRVWICRLCRVEYRERKFLRGKEK